LLYGRNHDSGQQEKQKQKQQQKSLSKIAGGQLRAQPKHILTSNNTSNTAATASTTATTKGRNKTKNEMEGAKKKQKMEIINMPQKYTGQLL